MNLSGAERGVWIVVSAIKCAMVCAHICRIGSFDGQVSQDEGSARITALKAVG
jgi:hypothetical protein